MSTAPLTRPAVTVGDTIRVTFTSPLTGDTTSQYLGTVTEADHDGVQLADVTAYEADDEAGPYWYALAEVGLAWPRSNDVHVYKPHPTTCVCSGCHDYS